MPNVLDYSTASAYDRLRSRLAHVDRLTVAQATLLDQIWSTFLNEPPRCPLTFFHRPGVGLSGPVLTRPRYHVIAAHNQQGNAGWRLFDRDQQCITGGWFALRITATRTAAVLNDLVAAQTG